MRHERRSKADRRDAPPQRVVIVQQIKNTWSKAERGGEGAVRRNAVPEVARVPLEPLDAKSLIVLLHRPHAPAREQVIVNPEERPLRIGCVTVSFDGDEVVVEYTHDQSGGAPDRWDRKRMTVGVNEWAQVVDNGRYSWEADWWYEKRVVNVGLFEPPAPDVFTRNEPTYRFSAMALLW